MLAACTAMAEEVATIIIGIMAVAIEVVALIAATRLAFAVVVTTKATAATVEWGH